MTTKSTLQHDLDPQCLCGEHESREGPSLSSLHAERWSESACGVDNPQTHGSQHMRIVNGVLEAHAIDGLPEEDQPAVYPGSLQLLKSCWKFTSLLFNVSFVQNFERYGGGCNGLSLKSHQNRPRSFSPWWRSWGTLWQCPAESANGILTNGLSIAATGP